LQTTTLGFTPVPIADSDGRTIQERHGTLWELAPWMPGAADRSGLASTHVRRAYAGMAAFHQMLSHEGVAGVSPGLKERYLTMSALIGGGFDRLTTAVDRSLEASDDHRFVAKRWLALARVVAPRLIDALAAACALVTTLQPCLRDARPEHFLFDGERLSGLVDFGAMGVDSVAGDLARLTGEWLEGSATARGSALAAYESVRPLDAVESRLIGIFESSTALLIGERWVRWQYLEGRRFDDSVVVLERLRQGLGQLERVTRSLGQS
jgi:homoserine kinase type II